MQKICIGILIAICVIAFVVNIGPWGYYPTSEWNFEYRQTFLRDYLDRVKKSSELTELCEEEEECKLMLDQYNFNGTI